MSTAEEAFEQAAVAAKSLPERPDDNTMLQLYALYKQGSAGDVQGNKPGFFSILWAPRNTRPGKNLRVSAKRTPAASTWS